MSEYEQLLKDFLKKYDVLNFEILIVSFSGIDINMETLFLLRKEV